MRGNVQTPNKIKPKSIKKKNIVVIIVAVICLVVICAIIYECVIQKSQTYTVVNGYVEKSSNVQGIVIKQEKVIDINKYWQVNNVSIMGKTGTAQIASPKGGYLTGTYDYIKSFAGIFPADDPKYIVYVAGKKPETNLGSWAKVITTAIEEIASYAKLTESKSDADPSKIITLDNYISKYLDTTLEELKNKIGLNATLINPQYFMGQIILK